MFLADREWNRRLFSHQQRVAAGPAGLNVTARDHVGDAIGLPFMTRQMFDHDRARVQGLRRFPEEAGQHAVLKTLDVDLQRIETADAGLGEDALQAQRRTLIAFAAWSPATIWLAPRLSPSVSIISSPSAGPAAAATSTTCVKPEASRLNASRACVIGCGSTAITLPLAPTWRASGIA